LPTSQVYSVKFGAIKMIPNATVTSSSKFASHQTKKAAPLTREAFAELNALRLLNGHVNVTPLLGYFGAEEDWDSAGGFGGWDWADNGGAHQDGHNRVPSPTSLCLVFPYHPIDLNDALNYRRFHPSSFITTVPPYQTTGNTSNGNHTPQTSHHHLPPVVVQSVMHDILSALHHLHSHHILHRDIKPGNLYVTMKGRIQIGDFGLAKAITQQSTEESGDKACRSGDNVNATTGMCTLQYRPPEMLLGGSGHIALSNKESNGVNGALDMWSAGCVFAELSTLAGPLFPGQSVLDQLNRIFQLMGTPTEESWPEVSLLPDWNKVLFEATAGTGLVDIIQPEMMRLISSMISLDPLKRSSAQECQKDQWLRLFRDQCNGGEAFTKYAHQRVAATLIPSCLEVIDPIYYSTSNGDNQSLVPRGNTKDPFVFAKQRASKLACARQNFMRDTNTSKKDASVERWTCEAKDNGLLKGLRMQRSTE
jgi:serine/threonine protein kinase